MIVTVEVVWFRNPLHAFRAFYAARRGWFKREREQVPGRTMLGCVYTFRGQDLHPPRKPKPRVFKNSLRSDAWGWFPTLNRIFIMSAWESDEALERYEASRPYSHARERWVARLRPVKVKGEIMGEKRLPEMLDAKGTDDLPGMVVTWNRMYMHRLPIFRLWVRRSADQAQATPGSLASFNSAHILSPPQFYAFTITCWRRLGDMLAFSYRGEPHKSVIKWYGNPHRFGEPWWGRFVVESSSGKLAGRDPFEGIELQKPQPESEAVPVA